MDLKASTNIARSFPDAATVQVLECASQPSTTSAVSRHCAPGYRASQSEHRICTTWRKVTNENSVFSVHTTLSASIQMMSLWRHNPSSCHEIIRYHSSWTQPQTASRSSLPCLAMKREKSICPGSPTFLRPRVWSWGYRTIYIPRTF